MRARHLIFGLALSLSSFATFSQQADDHSAHHPDEAATSRERLTDAASADETDGGLMNMQEQRERMRQARTAEERAAAMREHRQAMRAAMEKMMGSGTAGGKKHSATEAQDRQDRTAMKMDMAEGEMMGCMMKGMMKDHKKTQQRLQLLEKRIAMMQQMMINMMDSEETESQIEQH